MEAKFDLELYLKDGTENLLKTAMRASASNPSMTMFLTKFARVVQKTAQKNNLRRFRHIPPVMTISVTEECNLRCGGCYTKGSRMWMEERDLHMLSDKEWADVFAQARRLGMQYIIMTGGEPLIRRDVIRVAGKMQDIIFPIFTNGTMINRSMIRAFDRYRNLIPFINIGESQESVDKQKGLGIYRGLMQVMDLLYYNEIFFGATISVTAKNVDTIATKDFINMLQIRGCRALVFLEDVPPGEKAGEYILQDRHRYFLEEQINDLKKQYDDFLFLTFPGDVKKTDGCLGSGRGFMHINSFGNVEPCPFTGYSDTNIRTTSLEDAVSSSALLQIQEGGMLQKDEMGRCILFEKENYEQDIVNK